MEIMTSAKTLVDFTISNLRIDRRLLTNFVPKNEQKMIIRQMRCDITLHPHSVTCHPRYQVIISALKLRNVSIKPLNLMTFRY